MPHNRHFKLSIASLAVATLVAACGGGGSSSSSSPSASASTPSSGSSNTATGSVTGFGSIVVDGIHYDDANAPTQKEGLAGKSALTEVKLGHRVLVTFDGNNVASKIEVLPELEGTIASIDAVKSRLVVNGLTVALNSDPNAGPLTLFGGGYTKFADLVAGDPVEIHGLPVLDTSAGAAPNSYVVQATRIEKRGGAVALLKAGGFVQNLTTTTTATTFVIGGLTIDATGIVPVPAGKTLANGQFVFVASSQAVSGGTMKASSIRILDRSTKSSTDIVRLAGEITGFSGTSGTFLLDGMPVNAKNATILPRGGTPANAHYARVTGSVDATGTLVATEVQLRDMSVAPVELKGSVAGFNSLSDFTVRGVPVDASAATLVGCPATGLANNQFVLVHGTVSLTNPKVQASDVNCSADSAVPPGVIIERTGQASAVNAAARSFTLTLLGGKSVTVTWSDTTFFDGSVTAATLTGTALEVEGVLATDGSLSARKIRPAH